MTRPTDTEVLTSARRYLIATLSDPEYGELLRTSTMMRVESCDSRDSIVVIVFASEEAMAIFEVLRGRVFRVHHLGFAAITLRVEKLAQPSS